MMNIYVIFTVEGKCRKLKKTACFIMLFMMSLFFTGCEFDEIDALLSPPKLSRHQQEISQALKEKSGKKLKLKYPKSGEYRSAFVISNIDDEPTEEAIVFYENTLKDGSSGNIRIDILDNKDDEWISVFSHPVTATEVEEVMISKIGNSDELYIIVGYSTMGQRDKTAEIYKYSSDSTLVTVYTAKYSDMILTDLEGSGTKQLVIITPKTVDTSFVAKIVSYFDGELVIKDAIALSDDMSRIVKMTPGYVSTDRNALYIDAVPAVKDENAPKNHNNIQTQIIYYANGELKNPLILDRGILMEMTLREDGYYCYDIDDDGIVEIPHPTACPRYENTESKMYFTDWFVYERASFMRKCTSYYNITDGYCFILPNRWNGTVTVKVDPVTDEIVFYKFDKNKATDDTELMRILTCRSSESDDFLKEGYKKVASKGQFEYLVKLSDKKESLVPTWGEVIFNFINIK